MSTTLRLALITILMLLVGCTDNTPVVKPTRTPSPTTGLKGSASLNDPIGDVKLVEGKTLDRSADVRRVELMADGSTLHSIVQFAKPLPPIDQHRLECRISMGARDRLPYLLTLVRSAEAQPPTFWIVQGGFIDPNVTPERHPFTVIGDRISAAIPIELLDGLPSTFLWTGQCHRDVQTQHPLSASGSEDSFGAADTVFKGTM